MIQWINSPTNAHEPHQSSDALRVHRVTLVLQVPSHLPDTVKRGFQELPVDALHQGEVHLGLATRLVVERRPRDRQQAALRPDRQGRMVGFDHLPPHLPVQGLSFRDKKIVGDCQLPDPGVPLPDRLLVDLGGLLLPAALEDVRRPFEQRLLPLMDHRRLHAAIGSQLRYRALALHSFQRHASLEARLMVPAFRHVLISLSFETSRRQIVASVTVRISGRRSIADFMRHDKVNGRRYDRSVDVIFTDVAITTGRE